MQQKAILFDLDGTLWDSSEQVITAWNECIRSEIKRPEQFTIAQMQSFMGKTIEEIAALMFPTLSDTERCHILMRCTAAEHEYLKDHPAALYPFSKEIITQLASQYTLGIVSNCQEGYIEQYLKQCGFGECFTDHECAGRTGQHKGENIRLVMQRNGITDCIYVGDTQGDANAADFAGISFVHAAYGFGSAEQCAAVLLSIAELPPIAATLLP